MTGGLVRTVHRASSGDTQPSIVTQPRSGGAVVFVRRAQRRVQKESSK